MTNARTHARPTPSLHLPSPLTGGRLTDSFHSFYFLFFIFYFPLYFILFLHLLLIYLFIAYTYLHISLTIYPSIVHYYTAQHLTPHHPLPLTYNTFAKTAYTILSPLRKITVID
jgi:hypothetical protein